MYNNKYVCIFAILLLGEGLCFKAYPASLEVGNGQIYASIGSALTASSSGDVVNVHSGTYMENINILKSIYLRVNSGDYPIINGNVFVSANNVKVDGFMITGFTGTTHGISINGRAGVTIRNNIIDGNGVQTGSGSCVYTRNTTDTLIDNNIIRNCQKGININSSNSSSNSYLGGTIIQNNHIYNNPVDGIDIQGEYITISGNKIENNIDVNWAANHADGIQFIRSDVDGYSNVKHARVFSNVIKNHTQNIFLEGYGVSDPVDDVDIFNNVIYNDQAMINGVDMTSINSVHILLRGVENCRVYNNYLGYLKGAGLLRVLNEGTNTKGVIIIKNNIFQNTNTNTNYYAVYTDAIGDITPENLNYNIYNMSGNSLFKNGATGIGYVTIGSMQSVGFELRGMNGNPSVNIPPMPMPRVGSIAIDRGMVLGASFSFDIIGTSRPQGTAWDIGPYEVKQSPPRFPDQINVR